MYIFLDGTQGTRQEAINTVSEDVSQSIIQKTEELQKENTSIQTSNISVPKTSPVKIQYKPKDNIPSEGYLSTIQTVLAGKYFSQILWDFPLIIDSDRVSPRGQMTNMSIILSGRIKNLSEMAKVLVHELGHIVDIYILKSRSGSADPSQIYYAISWQEPTVLRPYSTNE